MCKGLSGLSGLSGLFLNSLYVKLYSILYGELKKGWTARTARTLLSFPLFANGLGEPITHTNPDTAWTARIPRRWCIFERVQGPKAGGLTTHAGLHRGPRDCVEFCPRGEISGAGTSSDLTTSSFLPSIIKLPIAMPAPTERRGFILSSSPRLFGPHLHGYILAANHPHEPQNNAAANLNKTASA